MSPVLILRVHDISLKRVASAWMCLWRCGTCLCRDAAAQAKCIGWTHKQKCSRPPRRYGRQPPARVRGAAASAEASSIYNPCPAPATRGPHRGPQTSRSRSAYLSPHAWRHCTMPPRQSLIHTACVARVLCAGIDRAGGGGDPAAHASPCGCCCGCSRARCCCLRPHCLRGAAPPCHHRRSWDRSPWRTEAALSAAREQGMSHRAQAGKRQPGRGVRLGHAVRQRILPHGPGHVRGGRRLPRR